MSLIDAWNVEKFDDDLAAHLRGAADLTNSDYLFEICDRVLNGWPKYHEAHRR